ncbi:hypothetical protein BH18ACT4_BH18ACT4_02480 [soil metagenome]
MLMPAAVLIVVILGAIPVALSVAYLGRRELAAAAAAAANDAVTYGVDDATVRAGGGYHLDPDRVRQAVLASLAGRDIDVAVNPPVVEIIGPGTVRVTLTGQVDYIFAPAIPGGPQSATVAATASADAEGA